MIVGLLITDGGPHSPDKWGRVTASRVIDIAAEAQDPRLSEARALENTVTTILVQAHAEVQAAERKALATVGPERLMHPIDVEDIIRGAVQDVVDASRFSSFFEHFNKPETQEFLSNAFRTDLHHNAHIERSWHANAHPDRSADAPPPAKDLNHPACAAFRAVERFGHDVLNQPHPKNPALLSDLKEHGGRDLVSRMVMNTIPKRA